MALYLRKNYVCTLLIAGTALGQQEKNVDPWMSTQADFSIGITTLQQEPTPEASPPRDGSLTSAEQGQTSLHQSFHWHQWRLEKRRKALEDMKFELSIRTFYFDRSDFGAHEKQAWAIGGWLGVKTGYFLDRVAFGATVFTSNPIYARDDRDGTLLLAPGQNGFTDLGEFYADVRIVKDLGVTVGAKRYDTPFINTNDVRMKPNTFEAIVLQGRTELGESSSDDNATPAPSGQSKGAKAVAAPTANPSKDVPSIKYGIGYFYKIEGRNDTQFISMAEAAGAHAERGVWTAGALYEKGQFSIGMIEYYCPDVINIAYAESKLEIPLSDNWKLRLAGQYVNQSSVGEDLLEGHSFWGHQFGFKVELPVGNALWSTAFTHVWADINHIQNPWSGYPGYTAVQVQDFDRAGESAFLLRGAYKFRWIDGLSAYALAVFGTHPGRGQFRQNEFDGNLQWGPTKGILKNLSVRLRYGVVQQFGGDVHNLTDFRTICNYTVTF